VLARRLEQLGVWLRMSQSLLGIVAALGADAPEISSAVAALHAGQHDLGVGIVLGSNIFNLAALLGLSALLSGRVRVTRHTLLLNGGVAVAAMAVVAAQLCGVLSGAWSLVLVGIVMVPYVSITALPPHLIRGLAVRVGFGADAAKWLVDADHDATRDQTPPKPSGADRLGAIPALVAIVVASIGMVRSAVVLAAGWGIPDPIVGLVILAALTGIPNVVTAVQLAMRGRGSAVLSEALNSNTLNLIAGAAVPAMIMGAAPLSPRAVVALWWMMAMTLLALGIAFVRRGMGRKGGALLVVVYAAFLLTTVLWR
jgi:cation:H+ antiporter